MNIVGEGSPKEIIDQIALRQKKYGSGYVDGIPRKEQELIYLNANTSWCKLASSVNIDDPKIIQSESLKNLPNITNNQLAKKFVLFNGVTDVEATSQKAGISPDNNMLGNNNAYGIGGNEFGIRPMMGIKSAYIKHENRGSIRRATVQIKAFNRVQFDIIDILYLRLGFSLLLEWGHSMYYDNNGVLQTNSLINNSLVNDFLEGKGQTIYTPGPQGNIIAGGTSTTLPLTYDEFLKKIAKQRIESNGNYDAMFAKVTNFHWSFLPDGSYDITLDLVSIGDIVESFKINALTNGILTNNSNGGNIDLSKATDNEVIESYAEKNSIGEFFYNIFKKFKFSVNNGTFFGEATAVSPDIVTNKKDALFQVYLNGNNAGQPYFYIRLGTLLQFFHEKLMYSIKVGSEYSKALKFDYDVESNLMYLDPLQVSIDPNICVVNRILSIDGNSYEFAPKGEPIESPLLGSSYGQIMNIYINMRWILLELDRLQEANTNKTILIDFLNSIFSSINSSLGGMNALEATIDETTNTLIIREANPLPNTNNVIATLNNNKYNIPDKYAHFDLYGYNKENAGFIKDFSFTTELSPKFSTMITVGATANSVVVGENSTALSRLNVGLTDRFKHEVTEAYSPTYKNGPITYLTPSQIQANEFIQSISQKYSKTYTLYTNFLKRLAGNKTSVNPPRYNGEGDTYKNTLTNILTFKQQLQQASLVKAFSNNKLATLSSFTPGTGFIPFNLSLTMDGLSGMKIYNKFYVDSRFLPANYPDSVEFLIKNIEHKIENNKWFTTLESIVISKGEIDSNILNKKVDLVTGIYKTGSVTYISNTLQYVTSNTDLNFKKFLYPTTGIISSKVGLRAVQKGVAGSDQHRGIDIVASKGTPVYSSTDGVVSRIGADGYGPNAVIIEISPSFMNPPIIKKYYAVYGHMDTTNVSVGMKVTAGQQIGTVGDKGSSGSIHLHFQIRDILRGKDSTGLSLNINSNFPPSGGKIVAKQNFI